MPQTQPVTHPIRWIPRIYAIGIQGTGLSRVDSLSSLKKRLSLFNIRIMYLRRTQHVDDTCSEICFSLALVESRALDCEH